MEEEKKEQEMYEEFTNTVPEENKESYIEDDISDHVQESFLKYSLAVIASRAFPDVRDGLKPSQRRILYVLKNLNLSPGGKFRKSAKICGDTSGDFHPHGESVVYPTMVRMAQPWSTKYRLIDGQGNFGSIDGDPPGAMRYTEARMTKFTTYLLEDIDKDTVDMVANYDETKKEPVVFPAKFHNLLCNGSSGIAVGMSTYIPPHNMSEVIDATNMLLDNPEASIDEIMTVLQAPDFPTGGTICGINAVEDVYKKGRGKIILQGNTKLELNKSEQQVIIIDEIPYGVNKSRLIERIAECVENKAINEISDLRDESGRDGMRITITLKKGSSVEVALNKLYKLTPLRTTIACHLLALDKGAPKVMNIKTMIECWIAHRENVITRKITFELNKALEKLDVLEGFMKVLTNLDQAIQIIKFSENREKACEKLIEEIGIKKNQANSVLDLKLYRITAMEMDKISNDYDYTKTEVSRLSNILQHRELVIDIIKNDLAEIKAQNPKDKRQTKIERNFEDISSIESLIPNKETIVVLSKQGFIKRFDSETVRTQRRGGQGILGSADKRGDAAQCIINARMHDYILVFTEAGKCYWSKCWQLPEMSRRAQGQSVTSAIESFSENDKVTAMLSLENLDTDGSLLFCTRQGVVKKTSLRAFSSPRKGGIIAINLDEGDKVIKVEVVQESQKILIATHKGYVTKFDQSQVKEIGRSTRGVKGIKLKEDDYVVSCCTALDDDLIVFVSEYGYGKRTLASKIRETKRGGVGVKGMNYTKKIGFLVAAIKLEDGSVIMLSTLTKMIKVFGSQIRISGRKTQGVKLIALQKGDRIIESEVIKSVENLNVESEVADEEVLVS